MTTIEIFDHFIREGLTNDQCGICSGDIVNVVGSKAYFGCLDDSLKLRDNWHYLYYYGERDLSLSFMPAPNIFWGLCESGSFLYLWVLE